MTGKPGRVIWAYDLEHRIHPFIMLGVETLLAAGWEVTVVSADAAEDGAYRVFDAFSYGAREASYGRIIRAKAHLDEQAAGRRGPAAGLIRLWAGVVWKFGRLRHFTWARWAIYLRGFLRLARLDGEVMIATRPEAAVWAGLVAKARGMRFVYFPFELYGDQILRPNPLVAPLERFLLRHWVDAVLTQNDRRAAVLREERGARVEPVVVHNYKRAAPVAPGPTGRLRAAHGIPPGRRIVLYEGVIAPGRWLEFLVQSLDHLPQDVILVLMGREQLKWTRNFRKHLKAPRSAGRLLIAPAVPQAELTDYVADADVGVLIYDDSVRNNLFCEPGKLSDYLRAGVPMIGPDFPTLGPVLRGHGIGETFEGRAPETIAAAVLRVLARPRASWRPALERAAQELTWESQAPALLAAVEGRA